jgi:nucleotide-binding universal stress UspA family protein
MRGMALKSLVVFVEPTPAGEARIRCAAALAMRHEAHLIGVFIVPHNWGEDRADCYIRGSAAIRELVNRHKSAEQTALAAASRSFAVAAGHDSYSFEFRVIRDGDAGDLARLHALHTDLIVVGDPAPGGLPQKWSAERMLLATGVPVLIIPQDWHQEVIATKIVLGWNASRQARRAITDSLPILMAAQSVSVITVDADKNPQHGEEPGADIAHFLSRHGVATEVERLRSEGASVADAILKYAKDNRADLLVIGAYSHSRSQERMFGGTTRSLLHGVTIPTLIAH